MNFIQSYPVLALVLVNENEPLAAMLRDSEAPSHTSWRLNTDRVRKRWRAGNGTSNQSETRCETSLRFSKLKDLGSKRMPLHSFSRSKKVTSQ